MPGRTVFLLALLVIVAAGAWHFQRTTVTEAAPSSVAPASQPQPARAPASEAQSEQSSIQDEAALLAPFVPRLSRMADAFLADLGIDVRVITTDQAATSIEVQANEIFEQQQIGRDAAVGGLLIILNPRLSSARIEVGYTLEGALTDMHMGRIARDQLAPYVSYGAAGMAVMDVLHYLRDHVYLSAALGRISLPEDMRTAKAYLEYERYVSGGAGARTALSNVPMDADLKITIPPELRARYAPSGDVKESVEAFLRATADFAGDPTLELFTAGSRLMREHYPLAPFEELRRFERIEASKPLRYIVEGDYAVATSERPAHGFVPVLLHREQGLWRIDQVETWKNLFFDEDGNYFLRNSNTPYAFGLKQFGSGRSFDMAAVPLRDVPLQRWLDALDRDDDVMAAFWRAELWLRNAFVFPQALTEYEKARRLAPRDPLVLETIAERASYLGFPELAIPALESIGRGLEFSLAEAYNEAGDRAGAVRWIDKALEENPYDLRALEWRKYLADKMGNGELARRTQELIASLTRSQERPDWPVMLWFHPNTPRYEPDTTLQVDGVKVFDHSKFGVTLQNTSQREVEIESVMLTSVGNAAPSGLGDIKNYWRYPKGGHRLGPREHVHFEKQWGFTVDTGHRHVRYVFRTCWRGVGSEMRQCRTQWVDTLPYIPNPK
ncbi:TPM domain-containing protein [Steroidobacter sp. S1-65]|uniref:TPM domain-containing protein n=1 Tax=Steroidobacter gossypii TaxID=2805490 RepID=A0ABS1WV40_9GAMM|nr:TPM domain-containing protein [Steroidobacter gossypii]MBM0104835.1 TPM domain-containing protein [Steroidobacter gossypii]